MQVRVLGWLEAVADSGEVVDLGGAQPRLVVAMLVAAAGQLVSADSLVTALWGDTPPASAGGTLQSYVSRLRKALEPGRDRSSAPRRLIHEPPGYRLALAPDEVDFRRFERLADDGRALLGAGDPAAAAGVLRDALALWRGDPFADHADHEFARGLVARLANRHRATLADRVRADLALGRHAALVGELVEVVTEWPLEEDLRGLLALALYRSGRQAEALRVIDDGRGVLRDELGVELSRPLRELEHAILVHDPALDLPGRPTGLAPGPAAASAPSPAPPTPARSAATAEVPAAPTAAAVPAVPTTAAGAPPHEGLVGRGRELDDLLAAADEARAATRWAVIEGEPGIGKTRLAEEVAAEAEARGWRVLWGRAFEGGAMPAFWPWLPVLRALSADRGDPVPELARVLAPTGEDRSSGPAGDATRFGLFEAVGQLVTESARGRPLVVVLDDLQWADDASLELVRALATRVQDVPVLVLVTVRELDIGRDDAVVETLALLTRTTASRRLLLRGLDRSACRELVAQTVGDGIDPVLLTAIEERADGNPFFITELARLVTTTNDVHVPAGVRDVVGRRLADLPADTRSVLEQAAVMGRDAELEVLGAALGRSVDDVLDALEPAVVARLVEPSPSAPGSFRFAHALVRDVVIGAMSSVRRARGHLRSADALGALRPGDDHAEIVAEHLWEAAPIGTGRRAADALERAARVAMRRLAFSSAATALDRAWQLRRSAGSSPDDLAAELGTVARIVVLESARGGYPALVGSPVMERGKWLAERTGNERELLSLLYGEWAGVDVSGDIATSVPLAERLVRLAERSELPLAQVIADTAAGILAWRRGRLADSVRHLTSARATVDRLPPADPSLLAVDLEQLRLCVPFSMLSLDLMGELADPRAAFAEAVAVHPDDPYWELLVLNFCASGAVVRGDLERAEWACRRGRDLDPERVAGFWSNALQGYFGAARCLGGDLATGVAAVDDAITAYRQFGLRTAGAIWLSAKAWALARAGDVDAATAALEDARVEIVEHGEHYTENLLLEAAAFLERARGASADVVAERLQAAWDLAVDQGSFGSLDRIAAGATALEVELDRRGRP